MDNNSIQQQQSADGQNIMERESTKSIDQDELENRDPENLAGNVPMRTTSTRRNVFVDETNVPSKIDEGQQQSLANMQNSSSTAGGDRVLKKKREDRVMLHGRPLSFIAQAETFKELVKRSNILADKTMFIKFLFDLIDKKRGIYFALPSGSGKTMLLTMVEEFVNIDKKESKIFIGNEEAKKEIKLFDMEFAEGKKFAIMDEKTFVADNKNQFPTLFLSLHIRQYTAKDVKSEYNQIIKNLFEQYEIQIKLWMVKRLEAEENDETKMLLERYIRKFDKYLDEEMEIDKWSHAVQFFIELLHFRSTKIGEDGEKKKSNEGKEKTVIVLIDNADSALVNFDYDPAECADYGKELKRVISKTQKFLNCFIEAKYVKMFVFMGNYEITLDKPSLFTIFSLDRDLTQPDEKNLAKYFGFTQSEMEQFCISYRVKAEIQDEAAKYYNGLTLCSVPLFSIVSAMQMLDEALRSEGKEMALRVHLQPSNFFKQFHILFQNETIADAINQLIRDDEKWPCPSSSKSITANDVIGLLSFVHAQSPIKDKNLADIFMRFLNVSGYLIRQGNELIIPNIEYKMELTDLLIEKYYVNKYGFDFNSAKSISNVLLEILLRKCQQPANPTELLKKTIFDAFQKETFIKEKDDTSEVLPQTIIGCAALLLRYRDRTRLDKAMKRGGKNDRRRPDIILVSRSRQFGLVVELKWGVGAEETAKHAMGQIAHRGYLTSSCIDEEKEHINHLFAIGVAVNPNKLYDDDQDAVEVIIEKRERQNTDGKNFVKNFENYLQKEKEYPKPLKS